MSKQPLQENRDYSSLFKSGTSLMARHRAGGSLGEVVGNCGPLQEGDRVYDRVLVNVTQARGHHKVGDKVIWRIKR